MDPSRGPERNPGPDCRVGTDRRAFARRDGRTIHHICGACRMGGDPVPMTDPELRVRGIASLRVVDACVMPGIVSRSRRRSRSPRGRRT